MLRRSKRRYIALELECSSSPSLETLADALWSATSRLYGEYGASKIGLVIIEYAADMKIAIVRVSASAVESVRAAIASITNIEGNPMALHVIRVSGTLKSLRRKVVENIAR